MAFVVSLPATRLTAHGASSRACPRRRRSPSMCTKKDPAAASTTPAGAALEQRVRANLQAEGIDYELLLNAPRVLKLTQELEALQATPGADPEDLRKVTLQLERERRSVMRTGLKRVFEGQALLSAISGGALAFNVTGNVELVYRALGFWSVWLFTIPSLRARKGLAAYEKSALNVGFLAMPLTNVVLAAVAPRTGTIWAADMLLLGGLYAYYALRADDGDGAEQGRVTGILKYLDYGSGRERGRELGRRDSEQ